MPTHTIPPKLAKKTVTPNQQAFTEAQVAERYELSQKTLQAWRMKGGGPAFIKMGKAIRYLAADLEAFEIANKCASTSNIGV